MESENKGSDLAAAEREVTVGNIKFKVKSVFAGKVILEDALENIAMRKQRNDSLQNAG